MLTLDVSGGVPTRMQPLKTRYLRQRAVKSSAHLPLGGRHLT